MAEDNLLIEIKALRDKVEQAVLPPDLQEKTLAMIDRVGRMAKYGQYSTELERISFYVDWIISLPWEKRSHDVLDLKIAREVLDKNHYGLSDVKDRILEYLSVLILKQKESSGDKSIVKLYRAPILCFVGLVGTGKTTIAISIAKAMGREFARIPFGGMGSALDLRGQSRVHPDAEVGQVIKSIHRCGTKNPVILLDEIDRVAEVARGDIMGVLVELLDPEQNMAFRDHFIDHPFDLSEVLFIATCNNTTNIATAVLDRLEPIQMPSYNDEDKIRIARDFVLPKAMAQSGLTKDNLEFSEDVWEKIVRPLGYDAGIRTLGRTVNQVCRKVAKMIVEGRSEKVIVSAANVKEFIPAW